MAAADFCQPVGGYAHADHVTHAFLFDGTDFLTIDFPGAFVTEARDIDGQNVVGRCYDQSVNLHGFLFDGTTWTTLDFPDSDTTVAYGIDGNTIVGEYYDSTGRHGFLATVPEPSTFALAAWAAIAFSFSRCCNRIQSDLKQRGVSLMGRFLPMVVAVLFLAGEAGICRATVLTFDQFVDPERTVRTTNDLPANQQYGDNVSDFLPATPVGGQYVDYGSGGGLTPHVTVEYRWYYTLDPADPNPAVNGLGGVNLWDVGYDSLS